MTQNYHIAPHKPTVIRFREKGSDSEIPPYAALGGDTPENLRNHAAYIVKACNSHHDLLEALEEATAMLKAAKVSDGLLAPQLNAISKAKGESK